MFMVDQQRNAEMEMSRRKFEQNECFTLYTISSISFNTFFNFRSKVNNPMVLILKTTKDQRTLLQKVLNVTGPKAHLLGKL
jgi:hypothetical protein